MHLQADHLSRLLKKMGESPVDNRLVDDSFLWLRPNRIGMRILWSF